GAVDQRRVAHELAADARLVVAEDEAAGGAQAQRPAGRPVAGVALPQPGQLAGVADLGRGPLDVLAHRVISRRSRRISETVIGSRPSSATPVRVCSSAKSGSPTIRPGSSPTVTVPPGTSFSIQPCQPASCGSPRRQPRRSRPSTAREGTL